MGQIFHEICTVHIKFGLGLQDGGIGRWGDGYSSGDYENDEDDDGYEEDVELVDGTCGESRIIR